MLDSATRPERELAEAPCTTVRCTTTHWRLVTITVAPLHGTPVNTNTPPRGLGLMSTGLEKEVRLKKRCLSETPKSGPRHFRQRKLNPHHMVTQWSKGRTSDQWPAEGTVGNGNLQLLDQVLTKGCPCGCLLGYIHLSTCMIHIK